MLIALLFALATDPVTPTDVLAMMSRLPAAEIAPKNAPPPHWDRVGVAPEIAQAIVDAVRLDPEGPLVDDARTTAGLMVVFSAWEGGNQRCSVGSQGELGPFQLKNTTRETACTPSRAAIEWLKRAHANSRLCATNEPDERLAALASGSCNRARVKVRKRVELARVIAE